MSDSSKQTDPLIKAAACAVGIGFAALAGLSLAAYIFKWEGFWRGAGQPFATTLAALAAISAAAIALHDGRSQLDEVREQRKQDQKRYEEQRDQDQKRYEEQRQQDQTRWEDQRRRDEIREFRSRFAEATSQLADESPTLRLSGAYAMTALANDWRTADDKAEMMVCFGVLGAYVASPNGTLTEVDGKPDAGADGPVRALIMSLLSVNAEHYAADDEVPRASWVGLTCAESCSTRISGRPIYPKPIWPALPSRART